MDNDALPTLYTVGHGDRPAAVFVDVLVAHGVRGVADVRRYPASRRHPQFTRAALVRTLADADIAYCWLGAPLGGMRKGGNEAAHAALPGASLRGYAEHMATEEFRSGMQALLMQARSRPTALLCAERLPQQCHRALIADYLTAHGIPVVHLLDGSTAVSHHLHDAARLDDGRLVYDRGADRQLGLALDG